MPTIKELLIEIQRTNKFNLAANAVLLISTCLLTYNAFTSTQISRASLRSQRPYLALTAAYMQKNGNSYQVFATLENKGQRSIAPEFSIDFYLFRKGDGRNFFSQKEHLVIANSFPPGVSNSYFSPEMQNADVDRLPNFIGIHFQYFDSILNEQFSEIAFFLWKEDGQLESVKNLQDKRLLDEYMITLANKTN